MTHPHSVWWPPARVIPPLTFVFVLLGALVDQVWQPWMLPGGLHNQA